MNFQAFNDIHSSCDTVLFFAICITYYILKLKSYNKEVRLVMAAATLNELRWQWLRAMLIRDQQMNSGMLKPAYQCDFWYQEKRVCEQMRNVGNSVTFVLATPPPETVGRVKIEWFHAFGFLNETAWKKKKSLRLNPKDPPWNMVIGSGGRELRISPITESDISINYFTAVARFEHGSPKRAIHFAIKPMPTDIGVVYPGDTITIHMPSFVSLPAESMIYHWELEGGKPLLPSNMRPSRSGSSLTISELRKQQEGVLACGVFTNVGVFATQKRFLIKNVEPGYNQLIFIATRPPHQYIPLNKWSELLANIPKIFGKRDARLLPKDVDNLDPQLLKQFLSRIPELKKFLTENYNLTDKRVKRSLQLPESFDYFMEPVDSQQPDTNLITDFYFPEKDPELPSATRNLNKRQDDEISTIDETLIEDIEAPVIVERKRFDQNEMYAIPTPKPRSYFGDFGYEEDARFEFEAIDAETPPPTPPPPTKPLSFLEQHRQAIRERLYASKPRRKQVQISRKRLRTTTETPETLDEETSLPPLQERDIIAMLMSECQRDSQCSLNADCVKRKKRKPGFCRCRPKFEGNGIFCWENDKYKK